MPANRPRRPQQEDKPTIPTKKGKLNNLELAGIGLIFFAIILYIFSKCGGEKEPLPSDEQVVVTEQVVDSTADITANNDNRSSFSTNDNRTNNISLSVNLDSLGQLRKLYILADSLRLRKSPERTGEVLGYLSYGQEVLDLGETSSMEKLRISADEVRTAPWVKVRTDKGQIGWAFGAYMQFYPVPRPTTEQPNN